MTRVIIIRPGLMELTGGDMVGAALLQQFCYWTTRCDDEDGWIHKSSEDLVEELSKGASRWTVGRKITLFCEQRWLERRDSTRHERTYEYRVNRSVAALDYAVVASAPSGVVVRPFVPSVVHGAPTQQPEVVQPAPVMVHGAPTQQPEVVQPAPVMVHSAPTQQPEVVQPAPVMVHGAPVMVQSAPDLVQIAPRAIYKAARATEMTEMSSEMTSEKKKQPLPSAPDHVDECVQRLMALCQTAGLALKDLQCQTLWAELRFEADDDDELWDYFRFKLADLQGTTYNPRTVFGILRQDFGEWRVERAARAVGRHEHTTSPIVHTVPSPLATAEPPRPRVELAIPATAPKAAAAIWSAALDYLRDRVSQHTFRSWFEWIRPLGLDGQVVHLEALDDFTAAWLDDNHRDLLEQALEHAGVTGAHVELHVAGQIAVTTTADHVSA